MIIKQRIFTNRMCFIEKCDQDSAYTLYDRDFLANLGSVVLFAVVGTLFNVFVIGYGLYGLASIGAMGGFNGRVLDSVEALIFSSLISAVDPVRILAY